MEKFRPRAVATARAADSCRQCAAKTKTAQQRQRKMRMQAENGSKQEGTNERARHGSSRRSTACECVWGMLQSGAGGGGRGCREVGVVGVGKGGE